MKFLKKIKKIIEFIFQKHFFRLSNSPPLPYSINLDISWQCNLNCQICSARQRVSQTNKKILTIDQFKYILAQIPKLKYIHFMGLGEPLMNPFFYEFLKIAQAKSIQATLITNGILLTENNIKKLSNNLLKIYISIDSPIKEKFEKIRSGASFLKLIENIKRIRELRPEIELCILTVLMKENIEDLPGIIQLARNLNVSQVGFNHILSLDLENDKRFVDFKTEGAVTSLRKAKKLAKKYKIKIISRPLLPKARSCWQPWLAPLIMLDGYVYPCCFMDRSPKQIETEWYHGVPLEVPFYQYRMGNIFTTPFLEIWNGSDFKLLRSKIKKFEKGQKFISEEQLNFQRKNLNKSDKFSYCQVCLWRWNQAC